MKEKDSIKEPSVKKEQLTPMMKQYYAMKAEYPEALLLFRCGDFYETYGDDAVTASKVLGITLTKRSSVSASQTLMAGVPYHAINSYLPKLVRAGYKVAICDQLEDPKLAKGIVKRGVSELITPGIAFDDQMLEQKENNFLCGLCFEKEKCGAAFLDVSTGLFQVAEGSLDYIGTLLSSFAPKEIVVERGYERGTKERFGERLYVTSVEEWAFVYDSAEKRLCKQLEVESLKGFAIGNFPHGICAAGALLVYLEQTQHVGLKNICSISRIDADKFVWMDRFTFRNLEVFASASGNDGVSLVDVVDKCQSPMGARMLRSWLAMPVMDIAELNSRYDVVDYFKGDSEALATIQEYIGNLGDLERILSRAATGKILPREVMQLGRGLDQIGPIIETCAQAGVEPLNRMIMSLSGCDELLETIHSTMHPEPAANADKGDIIGSGVNAELDELRGLSRNAKGYLTELQERETERTGIPVKIGYNNVFGYYIEVRNTHKDKVPEDWVRKQTLVNAERYITEELKEYEAKILGAESRIYELQVQIYGEVVSMIQRNIPAIQKNCQVLSRLDVLSSFGDLATSNRYCRPTVDESYVLDIKAGRHPVIETLMAAGEEYVPNDIYLDNEKQQVMILTGPNMAGKSALLRQTALIVLLAQIGCFVPADSARIGYCDKIFTRVGATDNISRGESTFMVEMLETSMILHNMSARSLILLDEIGRGTSTYDGMSIARAIVEFIHENGVAKTLFATHYHELNDMETIYPRVKNFHIAVKEMDKKVIFLRKLREGGVEKSFGIHVARLAGMPRMVLDSAEATLAALEKGSGPVITAVESNRKQKKVKPHNTKEGHVEADGSLQLSFFQLDDPLLSSLRDDLSAADLNNMTPLQAFDLLRAMKQKLGI
ncbi:MAG: DNA mismatch repair protein MutS [Bacteroidales bacterium]|nr:DNA mismatch repair protein MutS [Bacteroidales bacterium]